MGERGWPSSYPPGGHDRTAKARLILSRIFGDGENPLAWGFTVFSTAGIRIRLHLLFIVYLLTELIFTLPGNRDGFVFVLPRLLAMLLLALLHELAHAWSARRAGAEVHELMLWPLGGLASPQAPGDDWRAELRVALAGPMMNLLLLPVFAAPLYLLTGDWGSLTYNPINWGAGHPVLTLRSGETTWWLVALGAFHAVNLTLLVFNLLLPMYPLDAARALEAVLGRTRPSHRAQWLASNTGLGVATAVGLVGLVTEDGTMLFALAVICGLICSLHRRRLQFLALGEMIPGYAPHPEAWRSGPAPAPTPLADQDDTEAVSQAAIDRILAKISASGIASLSRKERRTLKRATETSRKAQ